MNIREALKRAFESGAPQTLAEAGRLANQFLDSPKSDAGWRGVWKGDAELKGFAQEQIREILNTTDTEQVYSLQPASSTSVFTLEVDEWGPGSEQWFLLMSDAHWDNPHCDRQMLRRHYDQAVERNARIFSFGDFFCAMQGRSDRRADKSSLRPEHQGGNYLDLLIDTAEEWLSPYADHIAMMSDGNHEIAIRKYLETDLLERLCRAIDCHHMGYSGFVKFVFPGGPESTRRLYFHHGHGGGGPVTKGVIQTNRRAASIDADIFVSGHIHEATLVENVVVTLLDSGRVHLATQTHVTCPTYKQEYLMDGGFHIEKGRPPKPLGGWWLVFYYDETQLGNVGTWFLRAK
jgi:hypothetical protein